MTPWIDGAIPQPAALTWQADRAGIALLAATVVLAAILLLYPRQTRAMPRGWRLLTPLLRGLALTALAVSILRPAIVSAIDVARSGAVVVLVDRSASMGARDFTAQTDAGRAQLVALADALGRLPPGARASSAELQELVRKLAVLADEAVRLKNELDFARLSGRSAEATDARLDQVLLSLRQAAGDAQQRATLTGAPMAHDLGQLLRRRLDRPPGQIDVAAVRADAQLILENAARSQAAFDARVHQQNPLVRAACEELADRSRLELVERLLVDPRRGLLARMGGGQQVVLHTFGTQPAPLELPSAGVPPRLDLRPTDPGSRIGQSLRTVLGRLGSRPLRAVVLLSDGRQVGAAERSAPTLRVPVFAVSTAGPSVRDLAIASVFAPSTALVGEIVSLRVDARATGISPRELAGGVTVSVGDAELPPVPFNVRDDRLEPLDIPVALEQPGVARIRVALPRHPGEATYDNNTVDRWIKVVPRKARVALISSTPGWDFRYLRNALSRTPWVQLHDELLDADGASLSLGARQIGQQDVVILCDVSAGAMDAAQRSALRELAAQREGGLILVAGEQNLPGGYGGDPVLAEMLPWVEGRATWRAWPGEEAYFRPLVAPGAESSSAVRLDPDPRVNARRWDEVAPFYRYLVLPPLRPAARALLIERESRSALLTEMRLGRGKAFFVAMDQTWRWRYKVGERDHDRFWRQLIRHAMPAPYAVTDGVASLDLDKVRSMPGETVTARLRLDDESIGTASRSLQIVQGTMVLRSEELRPVGPGAPGRYEAAIRGLSAGEYEVRFGWDSSDDGAPGLRVPLRVADDLESELADISPDETYLGDLARNSGGKRLGLAEVASLPQLLADAAAGQTLTVELPLWDSSYLFLIVLGCLGSEWAIRKKFGLA